MRSNTPALSPSSTRPAQTLRRWSWTDRCPRKSRAAVWWRYYRSPEEHPRPNDAEREYSYGPAGGLPDTKVGAFTQALLDEAKKKGWTIISMKKDWKRIFAFEQ